MARRLGALLGAALLISGVLSLARGRWTLVAVTGHSMEPTLRDGDWLIVDTSPHAVMPPGIVVARDPRARSRLIVKRVGATGSDSEVYLSSDHPAHADERIGPVPRGDVIGRAAARYWPPSRWGRL